MQQDTSSQALPQHDDIKFSVHRTAGLILLDRPRALNAISADMALSIRKAVSQWSQDDTITHIVISASEPRAFCAGGDIRALYEFVTKGGEDQLIPHFREEYLADADIYECGKPVVALADGIVMGGGAGLMQSCTHSVVTDTSRFAMPESAIGLFPDAGASLFLGRCPRSIALLMGITGRIIGGADCLMLGLATVMVPSGRIAELRDALLACEAAEIDDVLERFRTDPGSAPLQEHRTEIDHIFSGSDLCAMRERAGDLARLKGSSLAQEIHAAVLNKCPMSMHVFLRLIERSDEIVDLISAYELDFHLAIRMTARDDFREGIRAVLIDKTNDAVWHPAKLEDVTQSMLDHVFDRSGLPAIR